MKINLPGLLIETTSSGATRWRVRVAGDKARRVALTVTPDHPEFMEIYHAARRGITLKPEGPAIDRTIRHSVAWLVESYLAHLSDMVDKGQASRATLIQRRHFAKEITSHKSTGAKSAGQPFADLHMAIPTDQLIQMRDAFAATSGKADNMIRFLRALFNWAIDHNLIDHNPAAGIKPIHRNQGGATPWTVDDLQTYRDHHGTGSMAHLALTLLMFTACRIGDAYRLGRANEIRRDGLTWIDWTPAKRGSRPVSIPMMPQLAAAIRAQNVIGPAYLLTDHGKPFASPTAFGNKFRDWCRAANLDGRSPHGIRKAAGHLLAYHGATQHQIMAIHGHAQAKTSEIYTATADRARLASDAMARLAGMDW